MTNDDLEVSKKLALISEVMADAATWIIVRDIVCEWEVMAREEHDDDAAAAIRSVNRFHKLCEIAYLNANCK